MLSVLGSLSILLSNAYSSIWLALMFCAVACLSFGSNQAQILFILPYLILIMASGFFCTWLCACSKILSQVSTAFQQLILVCVLLATIEHPTFAEQLWATSLLYGSADLTAYLNLFSSVCSLTSIVLSILVFSTLILELSLRVVLGSKLSLSFSVYETLRALGFLALILMTASDLLDFILNGLFKIG